MAARKDTRLVMSVSEAAQRLEISRDSAYKAVRSGELPVVKIGASLRVPTVVVERMIANALAKVGE